MLLGGQGAEAPGRPARRLAGLPWLPADEQEFGVQSSKQTCHLLKSVLHSAPASHWKGSAGAKHFRHPIVRMNLFIAIHITQAFPTGLCGSSLLLCTVTLRSQALFDAATEGTVSGFTALY